MTMPEFVKLGHGSTVGQEAKNPMTAERPVQTRDREPNVVRMMEAMRAVADSRDALGSLIEEIQVGEVGKPVPPQEEVVASLSGIMNAGPDFLADQARAIRQQVEHIREMLL